MQNNKKGKPIKKHQKKHAKKLNHHKKFSKNGIYPHYFRACS